MLQIVELTMGAGSLLLLGTASSLGSQTYLIPKYRGKNHFIGAIQTNIFEYLDHGGSPWWMPPDSYATKQPLINVCFVWEIWNGIWNWIWNEMTSSLNGNGSCSENEKRFIKMEGITEGREVD